MSQEITIFFNQRKSDGKFWEGIDDSTGEETYTDDLNMAWAFMSRQDAERSRGLDEEVVERIFCNDTQEFI